MLQKYFKSDPDEWEIKSLNSTCFLSKVLNFLRRFHRWKTENPQQRTNALFSMFFEGELQFHVRKEPQNDPEIVGKKNKFWQLFDKLVNFFESYQNFLIVEKSNLLE